MAVFLLHFILVDHVLGFSRHMLGDDFFFPHVLEDFTYA
jgi:hypothetical protein